jgi:hypothetical protein
LTIVFILEPSKSWSWSQRCVSESPSETAGVVGPASLRFCL